MYPMQAHSDKSICYTTGKKIIAYITVNSMQTFTFDETVLIWLLQKYLHCVPVPLAQMFV